MRQRYNYEMAYMVNKSILEGDMIKQYDDFINNYADKSDRFLYREIGRVQAEVPNDIKRQHLKNLDHLSQMEGFVTDDVRRKIPYVKRLIVIDDTSKESNKSGDTQGYFRGSSLLLWFLLVTVLFRRRYYYRPFY